jgi:hypothetical protein
VQRFSGLLRFCASPGLWFAAAFLPPVNASRLFCPSSMLCYRCCDAAVPSISCQSEGYHRLFGPFVALLVVFVVGAPLLMLALLMRGKRGDRRKQIRRFGVL